MESEKPNSAAAVKNVLTAVTTPVPNFRTRRSLARLEMTVQTVIVKETSPAEATDAPSEEYMLGHAAPKRESGSPRLTNAR